MLNFAWAGANPVGAVPDEPAHFVKAYATGDGQLGGTLVAPELSGLRPRSATWFAVAGRSYWLPARLAPPLSVLCSAFDPERTADCQKFEPVAANSEARVLVFTHVATYSPFAYGIAGLVMKGAADFRAAVWRGRLASLLICTMFIACAAALLRQRGAFALTGLVLAMTPAVVFVAASLNTSGVEITSAICVWSALLVLASEPAPKPGAWTALAVAGVALALTRPLGAVILAAVVTTVMALEGLGRVYRAIQLGRGPARACIASIICACAVSLLWARFAMPHPAVDLGLAADSLWGAVRDLPNQARDAIGIFGFNNTTMPMAVYLLGLVLLGGLGILALTVGTVRERVALIGLGVATIALNLGLAVLVEAQIGFGMQARYILPLAVGLMLVSADILGRHSADFSDSTVRLLIRFACAGAAALHAVAFLANQHRYAVGLSGPWLPPWDSRWSPEGGLGVWLSIAALGCVAVAAAGVIASLSVARSDDAPAVSAGAMSIPPPMPY